MKTTLRIFISMLAVVCASAGLAGDATAEPDNDSKNSRLLQDARSLIDRHELVSAIDRCEVVIAAFKSRYDGGKQTVFCARMGAESLAYLMKAAVENRPAVVLSSTWADAYFLKAYALQDLHRMGEAKANLERALELSPFNSQYLSELGGIYQVDKNWEEAEKQFKLAEENVEFSPDDVRASELGRARRGHAYDLVELGKLDEAEKIYLECLAADPKDTKAKGELEYVRSLRAKRK